MRVSDKLKKATHSETIYQRIAREEGVTAHFVGMIARGERKPQRGKGLKVYNKIMKLVNKSR